MKESTQLKCRLYIQYLSDPLTLITYQNTNTGIHNTGIQLSGVPSKYDCTTD